MRRGIRVGLMTLVCAIGAATAAHAQPPGQVLFEFDGVAQGQQVEVFVRGTRADHTIAGTSGSIASDMMSGGKPADIAIDRCDDGRVSVTVVEDGGLFPPEPDDCDRMIEENWAWGPGRRLIINARTGQTIPATTIGTRPSVQSASQAVIDTLRAEPQLGTGNAATTAAVRELAFMSDRAIGDWATRFGARIDEMAQRGAGNTTLQSMQRLLETVFQPYQFQQRNSAGAATASPAVPPLSSAPAAWRDFRIDMSQEYTFGRVGWTANRSSQPSATPGVALSGRVWSVGGAVARQPRTWYYTVSSGTAIGATDTGSAMIRLPLVDRSVEIVNVTMPSSMPVPTLMGPIPDRIMRNMWWLTRIVARTTLRDALNIDSRATGFDGATSFPRASTQQTDQGQVSLATGMSRNASGPRLPQLLLTARSIVDAIRLAPVHGARLAAFSAPGVRLVIDPRGRREYWIEPMQSSAAQAQAAGEDPRPSVKVFIRSLGRSTGEEAQQAIIINDGNVPVRVVEDDAFATEPVEGVSEQSFEKELARYAGRPRMTMSLTSYCLNFEKAAPTKGRIYRVAAPAAQGRLDPVRRLLRAAERVRDVGELHPDGDPNLYFHSVRQWAIWTVEKGFNERTFAEALLEYTKKNVVASGRKWTKEIDTAARSIIPNRWRDVQRVLAESRG